MTRFLMLITGLSLGVLMLAAPRCNKQEGQIAHQELKEENIERALSCKSNDDCDVVNAGCCGCRQAGKQEAIAKSSLEAKKAELLKTCGGVVCAQVLSNDPSCKKEPACDQGRCVLK